MFRGQGGDVRVTLTCLGQSELVGLQLSERVHSWSIKLLAKLKNKPKYHFGKQNSYVRYVQPFGFLFVISYKEYSSLEKSQKTGIINIRSTQPSPPSPAYPPKLKTSVRRPCFLSLLNLALWSQGMTSADPLTSFEILLKSRPLLRHELCPSYLNSACYFGSNEKTREGNLSCQTQLKSMKGSLFSKEVVAMEEEGKLLTMSLPYTQPAFLS